MVMDNLLKSIQECINFDGEIEILNNDDDYDFDEEIRKGTTPRLYQPIRCADGVYRTYGES